MPWTPFENGATISQRGSENGVIISDEVHDVGSRITLERGTDIAPFAITCGIYGWMFHTRYFSSAVEASAELDRMKAGLDPILGMIPSVDDSDADAKSQQVTGAIEAFVERFP